MNFDQNEFSYKSYIPSSIRLWNKLTVNIRSISTVNTFKINLKLIYSKTETYKPYLTGHTPGHIHLSRFRMQLSGLNSHRKKYHFIEHNNCPNCNSPNENPEHFFILCPSYAAHRRALFEHLERLLPETGVGLHRLDIKRNRNNIVQIIIFGSKIPKIDFKVFKYAAKYVEDTNRFT